MGKVISALIIILLLLIGVCSYLIYQNLPGQLQNMNLELKNPAILKNLTSEIKQFEFEMRFNHNNLTYFFSPDCDSERKFKMLEAFSEISNSTQITFTPTETDEDIIITCSKESIQKEKNVFIAGEGGPREFINSTIYPVILKGSILLYQKSDCKEPVVELHELLHVFGFDHVNDSNSIMYPYSDCTQKLSPEYTQYLTRLYSIIPAAELVFDSANLTKSGRYLNIWVLVSNKGMIDAPQVDLLVYAEGKEIQRFDLKNLQIGATKKFYAENIRLPSRSTNQVTLEISYSGEEFDKSNNNVTAYLQE